MVVILRHGRRLLRVTLSLLISPVFAYSIRTLLPYAPCSHVPIRALVSLSAVLFSPPFSFSFDGPFTDGKILLLMVGLMARLMLPLFFCPFVRLIC